MEARDGEATEREGAAAEHNLPDDPFGDSAGPQSQAESQGGICPPMLQSSVRMI